MGREDKIVRQEASSFFSATCCFWISGKKKSSRSKGQQAQDPQEHKAGLHIEQVFNHSAQDRSPGHTAQKGRVDIAGIRPLLAFGGQVAHIRHRNRLNHGGGYPLEGHNHDEGQQAVGEQVGNRAEGVAEQPPE